MNGTKAEDKLQLLLLYLYFQKIRLIISASPLPRRSNKKTAKERYTSNHSMTLMSTALSKS